MTIEEKIKRQKEEIFDMTTAKEIAEHTVRILLSKAQYPEFPPGDVPVPEAAKIFGKDATWVRQGIIDGWLPIGIATKPKEGNRTNFYISPKKLWEVTGYVWSPEKTSTILEEDT